MDRRRRALGSWLRDRGVKRDGGLASPARRRRVRGSHPPRPRGVRGSCTARRPAADGRSPGRRDPLAVRRPITAMPRNSASGQPSLTATSRPDRPALSTATPASQLGTLGGRPSDLADGPSVGVIRSLRYGPDVLVRADEQALPGGAPARPRPGTGYPPRAPTCLRALTCSPPQRAFVCAISLGLQISERRVGVNGRRPDREDKPDRSRALWAIDLMLADGVNAEPRASPPTKLAAIQRHAHRIPINAAYQPTARRRTARIDCSCQDCVTRLRREVGFAR